MGKIKYSGYETAKIYDEDITLEHGHVYTLDDSIIARIKHAEGITVIDKQESHKSVTVTLQDKLDELERLQGMRELRAFAKKHGLKSKDNNIADLKHELRVELETGRVNVTEEV